MGTSHYSFTRLAEAADAYAAHTGEEVLIQLGYTVYEPRRDAFVRFLSQPELLAKIREAELVVTQGGFGSIAHCLRANKPLVAVPRRPELGEAEHRQDELVGEVEHLQWDIQSIQKCRPHVRDLHHPMHG